MKLSTIPVFGCAVIALVTACSVGSVDSASSASSEALDADPCAPCSDSCSRCLDQKGCGWDHVHGKCRAGGVYGPVSSMPGDKGLNWISGTWATTDDQCKVPARQPDPNASCAATSCRTCAELADCGWYVDPSGRGKCVAGTQSAPFVHAWQFDSGIDWKWNPFQCLLDSDLVKLPPGPTCDSHAGRYDPPSDPRGGGTGAPDASAPTQPRPKLDWTCDVTRVRGGVTESFTTSVCALPGEAESTADYYNCNLVAGASSCVTTNCVSHGCCHTGC